jgi:RNA polymerase sigma-70 factor (ECF subfamily)
MQNYRETLYYMMLKMTNNTADAEDMTIEAFGKAFANLSSYSPHYAFSTWLFRIATNNCIDFIRKRYKTQDMTEHGNESDKQPEVLSPELTPEEDLMKTENKEAVRVVVDKLKPHYRSLIDLRYFKEYSYEEISRQLDLPIGTVKAQLFRAREFLQNLIVRK